VHDPAGEAAVPKRGPGAPLVATGVLVLQHTAGNAPVPRLLADRQLVQRTFAGDLQKITVHGLLDRLKKAAPERASLPGVSAVHARLARPEAGNIETIEHVLKELDASAKAPSEPAQSRAGKAPSPRAGGPHRTRRTALTSQKPSGACLIDGR
jgi:hypothetical protein